MKILIVIEGGNLQNVLTDSASSTDIEFVVVDHDHPVGERLYELMPDVCQDLDTQIASLECEETLKQCCVCGKLAEHTDDECTCICPQCGVHVFDEASLVNHNMCSFCWEEYKIAPFDREV